MTRDKPSRPRCHRGLTLLETVLAVLLLTLVTTAIMSAVSFVLGTEGRARKRLAASEVANRLVLQYLDEKSDMPDRSRPIDYGEYRFVWDMDVSNVAMELNSVARRNAAPGAVSSLARFKLTRITVYDAEEADSGAALRGEPLAVLTRVYDPIAARNPDTMDRLDVDRIREMIQGITGGGQ